MTPIMTAVALFKQFFPGDVCRSKTMGLCIIPGKQLQALLDKHLGEPGNTEIRFICLRDGEAYTHLDNYVTPLHGKIQVKEY